MENETKPKWDLADAIKCGDEAHALTTKHQPAIEKRLKPDELVQFKLQIDELAKRRPAQQENLVTQKSKTKGQDEIMSELHDNVISIRDLVRKNNPNKEIEQAFGVGERMTKSVSSVIAGANIVIKAYNSFKEWSSTEAGILEEDITEISGGIKELEVAAGIQDSSMDNRRYSTLDKNVLQRMVENEVTRLSAIGVHVFRKKNPAVAALFENLIPSAPKPKETKAKTESKA